MEEAGESGNKRGRIYLDILNARGWRVGDRSR